MPISYTPIATKLAKANFLSNSMFTSRTGNNWDNWTYTNPAGGMSTPGYENFYTRGVCVKSSCPSSGTKTDSYITYSSFVLIHTAETYQYLVRYMHSSQCKSSYADLLYYNVSQVACSTAYHRAPLSSSDSWTESRFRIWNHTAPSSMRLSATTSFSFRLPSDCKYVKPRIYYRYSTTQSSIFLLDSVKLSNYYKGDIFSSALSDRVAVILQDNLMFPDTNYCGAHIKFLGNVNDTPRGVTGTMVGTANYFSSAYFSRFSTSIMYAGQSKNFIKNGHFSSSLAKGTANWAKNTLAIFATARGVNIFGNRSLKIGATSTSQYTSQSVSISGDLLKTFSFYAKNGISDGLSVEGYLSGVRQFYQSQNFSTSNWERMIFICSTVDSVRIYPYSSLLYSNNYCFIQGVQFENSPQSGSDITPYDIEHINGNQTRTKSYTQYSASLIDKNHGTMEFWIRPQNSYITNYFQILDWKSVADLWILAYRSVNDPDTIIAGKFAWLYWDPIVDPFMSQILSTVFSYKPNEQIHIAITWDKNYGELYVNGIKSPDYQPYGLNQSKEISFPSDSVTTFRIGSTNYSQDSLNGYMDEFRIEKTRYNHAQIYRDYLAAKRNVT